MPEVTQEDLVKFRLDLLNIIIDSYFGKLKIKKPRKLVSCDIPVKLTASSKTVDKFLLNSFSSETQRIVVNTLGPIKSHVKKRKPQKEF